MSTLTHLPAEGVSHPASGGALTRAIDRWIYVFMAASFIVYTLVGFLPDSLMKMAAVEAGERPPFPAVLHVHSFLMGAFLLLLLAQTTLMATGRKQLHQTLGIAGIALGPALVIVGFILVPTMYHQVWNGMQAAPPPVAAAMQDGLRNFDNIMLIQTRIGILFPIFLAIALLARRTDAGLHKRMMLLSIAPALPAAFDRMTWLPTTLPASPLAPDLYTIAAIAPMLLWDLYRTRTLHKAYVIWFSLFVGAGVVVHLLWNT
ncbi:MAG: hypothetical protein EON61_21465, partial [Alphaproteobacteria bacterium]